MAAPDLLTLLDFETQWDAALATVLAPLGQSPYSLQLIPTESTAELSAPRCVYDFTLGAALGPGESKQLRSATQIAGTAYEFTLSFSLVFDRANATSNQRAARAKLRQLMLPATASFINAFTYLDVLTLGENNASRVTFKGVDSEKYFDEFLSTWTGIFAIKADAWPA